MLLMSDDDNLKSSSKPLELLTEIKSQADEALDEAQEYPC